MTFRTEDAKNDRKQRVDIPRAVAELLRAARPEGVTGGARVFERGIGRHTFDCDLKRAGIPKRDELGRSASFHSLRHTFNQMLHDRGVPFRHAQRLMRHSDPRLTANVYLDADRLTVRDSVEQLPTFGGDTPRSTLEVVVESRAVSRCVATPSHAGVSEVTGDQALGQELSSDDASCPEPDFNGAGGNR